MDLGLVTSDFKHRRVQQVCCRDLISNSYIIHYEPWQVFCTFSSLARATTRLSKVTHHRIDSKLGCREVDRATIVDLGGFDSWRCASLASVFSGTITKTLGLFIVVQDHPTAFATTKSIASRLSLRSCVSRPESSSPMRNQS